MLFCWTSIKWNAKSQINPQENAPPTAEVLACESVCRSGARIFFDSNRGSRWKIRFFKECATSPTLRNPERSRITGKQMGHWKKNRIRKLRCDIHLPQIILVQRTVQRCTTGFSLAYLGPCNKIRLAENMQLLLMTIGTTDVDPYVRQLHAWLFQANQ